MVNSKIKTIEENIEFLQYSVDAINLLNEIHYDSETRLSTDLTFKLNNFFNFDDSE